jgi:peptide methionine sulfoxide reductase MsrA
MTKTDFAELKERLTKLDDELSIKKQFEKEVTEYRYAVYPDADKDQIQTMLADCGCHGYFDAAFIGVKTEHTKSAAIISELIEIIQIQSDALELSTDLLHNAYYEIDQDTDEYKERCIKNRECTIQTTARLQKLKDGK